MAGAALVEMAMIETLKDRVNGDAGLVRRGRYLTTTFLLEVGPTAWLISIFEGRIAAVARGPFVMPSSAFSLRAPAEEWEKFWSERPPPGSNRRRQPPQGALCRLAASTRTSLERLLRGIIFVSRQMSRANGQCASTTREAASDARHKSPGGWDLR